MTNDIRQYDIQASSTETFGRVLCNARQHHFIVDGPVQNGCPGEAITPAEIFLAGVAACGVELVQVLARQNNVPVQSIHVSCTGIMDRSNPVRPDVTLFNTFRMHFRFGGVTQQQGALLVESFRGR